VHGWTRSNREQATHVNCQGYKRAKGGDIF